MKAKTLIQSQWLSVDCSVYPIDEDLKIGRYLQRLNCSMKINRNKEDCIGKKKITEKKRRLHRNKEEDYRVKKKDGKSTAGTPKEDSN